MKVWRASLKTGMCNSRLRASAFVKLAMRSSNVDPTFGRAVAMLKNSFISGISCVYNQCANISKVIGSALLRVRRSHKFPFRALPSALRR